MKKITYITLLVACIISASPAARGQESAADTVNDYCGEVIGAPRVEKITDKVWAAIGYDLATTVLIKTSEGAVIVDTAMSPARAKKIRTALEKEIGEFKVAAIIYTHSHIDHIGGATVWVEKDTPIWSTDALPGHLLKQYGMFIEIEGIRGGRQFGRHVPDEKIPCSALGLRVDIEAALENGVLLPTHTFSGVKELTIGDTTIELHEAHGETHDMLFVWIPAEDTVIAGDNFYWSFPNIYTLRGTSPRPVNDWIASIDAMRALDPEHLVPNHTLPLNGKQEVAETLTNYRDAIQWVRDEVVRRANAGEDLNTIAENVKLPERLAALPYNGEYYGRVDWSAKAIFTNNLGWFDGRPEELYPLPAAETAAREIELMGGHDIVLTAARVSFNAGEYQWAAHLLSKLRDSGTLDEKHMADTAELLAQCYENIAAETINTNGAGYLLESAWELRNGMEDRLHANINESLAQGVPLEHIFEVMQSRLDPEKAMDVHEAVQFKFPDEKKRFIITVRRGIAEVVEGAPLPGTPKPVATLECSATDYRRIALGIEEPAAALSAGKLKITGNMGKFMQFLDMFDTGN